MTYKQQFADINRDLFRPLSEFFINDTFGFEEFERQILAMGHPTHTIYRDSEQAFIN